MKGLLRVFLAAAMPAALLAPAAACLASAKAAMGHSCCSGPCPEGKGGAASQGACCAPAQAPVGGVAVGFVLKLEPTATLPVFLLAPRSSLVAVLPRPTYSPPGSPPVLAHSGLSPPL